MTDQQKQATTDMRKKLLMLEELGEKGLDEFQRFKDRERQKTIRHEIDLKCQELLETPKKQGGFQELNEQAVEGLNKVYRLAWTASCKKCGHKEEEFPSKY